MDITGAYLQSEDLQRNIYVRLPKEFEPDDSFVYKLKKPLYGLSDAGRQFWLKVSKMFKENGYESVVGDECLYRKVDENNKLIGLVIIHVDDFVYNGTDKFVEDLENLVKSQLTVSKVDKGSLRFCGVDYKQQRNGVLASMEDYCESIEEYPSKLIHREKKTKELNEEQKSVLRGLAGQINWLAQICRPDLAYGGHQLSMRCKNGTIGDLKYANYIVKKAKSRPSKVFYGDIGNPDDCIIYGFTDASFTPGEKATSGQMIFLGNTKNDKVVPLLWKTKLVAKACRSPKDAETITLGTCADLSIFAGQQLEEVLFGVKNGSRFKSILFSDSDSSLKSIVSSKQVERRYLRSDVHIMKQFIEQKLIDKIVWIGDSHMIADILTKDKSDKIGLDEMMRDSRLRAVMNRENYIFHDGRDYKMIGKAIKDKIVKQMNKIPVKRKLAKTHEAITRAKEEAKAIVESEKTGHV